MYYVNIFFSYSFLGFLFESVLRIITNNNFNSGVLYGPWTFIYGIAVFLIMGLNKFLKKFKLKKLLEIFLFFLGSAVLMTFLEFLGGFAIERLFHIVYWDYTNMTFNLGNYITLEVALFWGIFATFMNYLVIPHLNKGIKKIPKYITIVVIILFIIDIIATIIN